MLQEVFELQDGLHKLNVPYHCFSPPFFTLPALAHALWKRFGMPINKLHLLENQRGKRKTSRKELEWVSYLAHKTGRDIWHAMNHPDGQRTEGPYAVDGADGDTIFEFLGCSWHGHVVSCASCPHSHNMNAGSLNPYKKRLQDAYVEWQNKKAFLEKRRLTVSLFPTVL